MVLRRLLYRVYNGKGKMRAETPYLHVAEYRVKRARRRGKRWYIRTFFRLGNKDQRSPRS
jgi:hypothetical protein